MELGNKLSFETPIKLYNETYHISETYPYQAFLSDDLYESISQLYDENEHHLFLNKSKDEVNQYSGLLVLPNKIDQNFYILFSRAYLSQYSHYESVFMKTFFHEYTHLIDYFELKEKWHIHDLRNASDTTPESFRFYSEIRARFRSSLLLFDLESYSTEILLNGFEFIVDDYRKTLLSLPGYQRMYMLAQFWGQYLAITHKINNDLQIPQYISNAEMNLLAEVSKNILDISLFDHYEKIKQLYGDL
ncbi:hypothetical protein Q5O14_05920 [Eubacteriaceae bacterium ES2]|nr:hypothetical protein Q5O14_05920 [Eubacteriaceae bacterium ES2]